VFRVFRGLQDFQRL